MSSHHTTAPSPRPRLMASASPLILLAILLAAARAFALSQRGHEYCEHCTIAAPGSGEGQLSEPHRVAVNEADRRRLRP